jgi:hypothetical protein
MKGWVESGNKWRFSPTEQWPSLAALLMSGTGKMRSWKQASDQGTSLCSFPTRPAKAGAGLSEWSHPRSHYESQIVFNPCSVFFVSTADQLPKQRLGHHMRGGLELIDGLYRWHGRQRE